MVDKKITNKDFEADTLNLHAGQKLDTDFSARAQPIYQTTSYVFDSTDSARSLFNLEKPGHIYSRISNPTVSALEERIAAIEGGVGALCTSSGQAALHLAIVTLMDSGSHIVSSNRIYGGSRNLLGLTLKRFGIDTTFVDFRDIEKVKNSIKANTKLVFSETIGNPGLEVLDISTIADIAHEAKLPLLVDNTLATPYLCNPLELGADLVLHSLTKFIGGHGVAVGGAIIDSGEFDWSVSGKFKNISEPYEGYDGLNYLEEFGPGAFLARARSEGLRDFGASMSPQNAFYILMGVETLGPRMMRHVSNAEYIASFLEGHKLINWVSYPGLKSHKEYSLASKIMPKGSGAIISFGIIGGIKASKVFIENLKIFSHLANVGDAKSLVIHPASTTHAQLNTKELDKLGIKDDLIRLSVGLEDVDDLIKDLIKSLKVVEKLI